MGLQKKRLLLEKLVTEKTIFMKLKENVLHSKSNVNLKLKYNNSNLGKNKEAESLK